MTRPDETPWLYERVSSDKLYLFSSRHWSDCQIALDWRVDLSLLHITALFNQEVGHAHRGVMTELYCAYINAELWFGFFGFHHMEGKDYIIFRHSHLFTDQPISAASCEALIEIAYAMVERWDMAFHYALKGYGLKASLEAVNITIKDSNRGRDSSRGRDTNRDANKDMKKDAK